VDLLLILLVKVARGAPTHMKGTKMATQGSTRQEDEPEAGHPNATQGELASEIRLQERWVSSIISINISASNIHKWASSFMI
jgi:hypothetical protein